MHDRIRTVSYWEAQARWQQAWLAHCDYHREIIPLVAGQTAPGWRVLDIGAGSGVLALPLRKRGCRVTALEPSRQMRALLRQAAGSHIPAGLTIDRRSWEAAPISQFQGFHLILACNSLHVTAMGFSRALAKIFQAAPRHICLISENRFLEEPSLSDYGNYHLAWQQRLTVDSSLAYHSLAQAWEHFQHHWGRLPTRPEKIGIINELTYREGLYWLQQEAQLTVWWWSRIPRRGQWPGDGQYGGSQPPMGGKS